MPKETTTRYLECSNFTPGLNTLDDPIDLDPGASPFILNMDITKKGKLLSRYGYEEVADIPDTIGRGIQAYYRTYNEDDGTIDQQDDPGALYANTYTMGSSISELAVNKKTFTPSSIAKGSVYKIAVYVVNKGTGNVFLYLHDASNNLLAFRVINNADLTNGAFNYFEVPYEWTSGALHFHVTSSDATGTLKCNVANDLSTASFIETYSTIDDYLIVHMDDGNSYYITNSNTTPTSIGAWGYDHGKQVRGATFTNLAIYSDGSVGNALKQWDGTTLLSVPGAPPKSNIFATFQKRLFVAGDKDAPSKVSYSDVDALTNIASNFINITVGDGWDVTALVANNDFLQTYKTDTINGINFSFDSSYDLTLPQQQPIVNSQGGVWATGSAQAIYGYTYYMSNKGFETYGPSPERVVADRPLPLSLEIEPTFKTVNMQYVDAITSAFFDNKYLCAAPLRPSRIANYVFVYNESIKRRFGKDNWTMYNDIPSAGFAKFRNSNKVDELYFVTSVNGKIYKFNNTFSDAGNGYLKLWTSKTFKFGERTQFYYIDFEGVITLNAILQLKVVTDDIAATTTIDKSNLISPTIQSNSIGGSYVGSDYVGGGFTGSAVPLYKFKKRYYLPQNVNQGYSMYFQLWNQEDTHGWGLNRYVLAYRQDPEDPTYERTN